MDIRDLNLQDITLETFDQEPPKHTFSPGYKKRRKEMLRQFRWASLRENRVKYTRAAVAAAALVLATPFAINAATGGSFFEDLWGTSGRKNVTAHEETRLDEEKGTSSVIPIPQKEYVENDPAKTEELLGESQNTEPVVTQIGGVTMTLLSAVADGNAAAVEFTLEQEGGFPGFIYSDEYNNDKGAWFDPTCNFWFGFHGYNDCIFVDTEKSTDDKLYCYDYLTYSNRVTDLLTEATAEFHGDKAPDSLILETRYYPSDHYSTGFSTDGAETNSIQFPVTSRVATTKYMNEGGGSLEISPISLYLPYKTGLELPADLVEFQIYYINITYKDGSTYLVEDQSWETVHTAETWIENSYYFGYGWNDQVYVVFNRLVDVDQIASVTLNETTYTPAMS